MYEETNYGQSQGSYSYQEPVVAKTGFAIASLVCGILAFITTFFLINYLFGILAIIFAIVYFVQKADVKPKGKAITGLVLALISMVVSTTLFIGIVYYFANTELTDMMEDIGWLMGEEIDGREIVEQMVFEATGGAIDLETLEEFVGGEITIERIVNFTGDVTEIEMNEFMQLLQQMDYSSLASEFPNGITYEALEEKLGVDFKLRELMEYVQAHTEKF